MDTEDALLYIRTRVLNPERAKHVSEDAKNLFRRMENVRDLVQCLLLDANKPIALDKREVTRSQGLFEAHPFLIVSAAGTGKSWTIRQLMYLLATAPQSGASPSAKFIPLVIYVQQLATLIRKQHLGSLKSRTNMVEFYIRFKYERQNPAWCKLLLQAFRMHTLIIAFDGVDEAADLRDTIQEYLVQLVKHGHRFVVTSRPEGVTKKLYTTDFAILELCALTLEQQDQAIRKQLDNNEFYNHLKDFSDARREQDKMYQTNFSSEHQQRLQNFVVADEEPGTWNMFDEIRSGKLYAVSSMRQQNINGELIRRLQDPRQAVSGLCLFLSIHGHYTL